MQVIDNAIKYNEATIKFYKDSIDKHNGGIRHAEYQIQQAEKKLDALEEAREVLRKHYETT